MKRWVVGLVVVVMAGVGQVNGAIQWRVEDGGNGHYYETVDDWLTWPNAKAAAEQRTFLGVSGHLVTITTAAENDFVFGNIFNRDLYQDAWIGLTDDEAFGGYESFGQPNFKVDGWVWVTGEPVSYTNWTSFWSSSGEFVEAPTNIPNSDYAVLTEHKLGVRDWNDQTALHAPPYIVEYDASSQVIPEPSTFVIWSLLGLSCIGVGWWRHPNRVDRTVQIAGRFTLDAKTL